MKTTIFNLSWSHVTYVADTQANWTTSLLILEFVFIFNLI